jgi:hypothetical protein
MADYAAVDHGYATTIHKSQGATVDRAFVLASGTMDRHLTYVAMTRHRDEVALYAGRDEFSDMGALSGRLSRSQAKETTLDYDRAAEVAVDGRQRGAGAFGARRGIEDRSAIETPEAMRVRATAPGQERAADQSVVQPAAPATAARKRGMFDGLKLGADRTRPEASPGAFAGVSLPVRARDAERVSPAMTPAPDGLSRAVERYARAWTDQARMDAEGLPVLEHQKIALRDAGAALNAVRPGSVRDLRLALHYDPRTLQAMNELIGPARGKALVSGMEREAKLRANPEVRVERYVADWKKLEAEYDRHRAWNQEPERDAIAEHLKKLATAIQKDVPAHAVMQAQPTRFGIAPGSLFMQIVQGRSIGEITARGLSQSIGTERDIGLGRERSRSAERDHGMSM